MFPINIITNPNTIIIGHNIKFDIKFIEQHYKIKHQCKLYDTSVVHALIDENSNDNSLKNLAAIYTTLGHYEDNIEVTNLENEQFEKVIVYNCLDSIAPLLIFEKLYPELISQGLWNIFLFISEMTSIFVDLEQNGIQVNIQKLAAIQQKHLIIRDNIRIKYPKSNLASDTVLREILYEHFQCPQIEFTKGHKPSTSKDTLNALKVDDGVSEEAKNFIQDILDFRLSNKLLTDHLPRITDNLVNGRFFTSYNLAKGYDETGINRGTVTGRLSSSPNIQNIPTQSEIREIFECSNDYNYFVTADYSQIELRVAAFLSREPNFIDAFNTGKDIHTAMLASIQKVEYSYLNECIKNENHPEHTHWNNYRLVVKRVNFGILYRIGAKHLVKLIQQMGIKLPQNEVEQIIQTWYLTNSTLMQWLRTVEDEIIDKGYYTTIFGRRRHLAGANRRSEMGNRILRQGINFPIQSAASDICLLGIKNLHYNFNQLNKLIDIKTEQNIGVCRLLMTVHDEISFETTIKNQNFIKQIANNCMVKAVYKDMKNRFGIDFDIPLEIDIKIGKYWKK